MMFWLRVLAVAQVALLVRRHLALLEPDERSRLGRLVAQSKGRPRKNLSADERAEMLRLVQSSSPEALPVALGAPPADGRAESPSPVALKRVIPCLDIEAGRVVKGTNFVGLRDAGDPVELAERYDTEGADELVFLDITASHERRETIVELARRTADNVFIPFTIGGGIRSVADAQGVLDAGADKVSVNFRAGAAGADRRAGRGLRLPVRGDRDRRQGSSGGRGRVGTLMRRPDTSVNRRSTTCTWTAAARWSRIAKRSHGRRRRSSSARGEVLLTSMDRDGTTDGYELELTRAVADAVGVPVIASGGAGRLSHLVDAVVDGGADAVLAASIFHYGTFSVADAKRAMSDAGIAVRDTGGAR